MGDFFIILLLYNNDKFKRKGDFMKNIIKYLSLLIFIGFIFILSSCGNKKNPALNVGNSIISQDDNTSTTTTSDVSKTTSENGENTTTSNKITTTTEENVEKYTITWLLDDDTLIDTEQLYEGSMPSHIDPTKEGNKQYSYNFIGWIPELKEVDGDQTYKANFEEVTNKYTYTFYNDDNETIIKTDTIDYGSNIIKPTTNPTKQRDVEYEYTFAYWKDENGNKVTTFGTIEDNVSYYAYYNYTEVKYTITFDTQGGTYFDPITKPWGSAVYAPTVNPVKTGCKFDGWDKEIPETMPKENITITAKWIILSYDITITNNTGYILQGTTSAKYNQTVTLSLNCSQDKNIIWSRSDVTDTYNGISYSFKMPAKNITITINEKAYSISGNSVTFGSYPQSRVKDSQTLQALESIIANNYPTKTLTGWTSYKYYDYGAKGDYMYYVDIIYKNEKYRAVYMTAYRPDYFNLSAADTSSPTSSHVDDNGYSLRKLYFFKFEPIKWTISVNNNGEVKLLADLILDSQAYCNSISDTAFTHNGSTTTANGYLASDIRIWLNNDFYNLAFNDLEKALIVEAAYSPVNTTKKDNVGLFSKASFTNNTTITSTGTDYAKCQGLTGSYYTSNQTSKDGDSARYVTIVTPTGGESAGLCYYNTIGVRPSVTIQL